jgi:hypothetical protein
LDDLNEKEKTLELEKASKQIAFCEELDLEKATDQLSDYVMK